MDDLGPKKSKIEETIKNMVGFMNLECEIEFREENTENNLLFVAIHTPENARFLIGKNGTVLKSLEHLVRMVIAKDNQESQNIVLDVNDYRKSRATYLLDLARQAVNRVKNTQKAEALMPMSSYERRIVHMELAACPDVATESIGEEPYRRVVIKPFKI